MTTFYQRFAVAIAIAMALSMAAGQTNAATFVVNSTQDLADDNPGDGLCAATAPTKGFILVLPVCTLRAAVQEAYDGFIDPEVTEIVLTGGEHYELTLAPPGIDTATGDLDIRGNVTIRAEGSSPALIVGVGIDRLFQIQDAGAQPAMVHFENLVLTGGDAQTDASGQGLGVSGKQAPCRSRCSIFRILAHPLPEPLQAAYSRNLRPFCRVLPSPGYPPGRIGEFRTTPILPHAASSFRFWSSLISQTGRAVRERAGGSDGHRARSGALGSE